MEISQVGQLSAETGDRQLFKTSKHKIQHTKNQLINTNLTLFKIVLNSLY